MKKINFVKISLDILMAIVFVLLFNKNVISGLSFHEIAGLGIGLAFIIHKAINWRWIRQVTLNIFSKNVAVKTKIGYVVDVILLFTMGYIIISGILISKVLFPDLKFGNEFFFKTTHLSAAYLGLLFLGIHVGLHWQWVINMFKNLVGITQKKKILSYISKAAAVLVIIAGIYCTYSTNYFSRVVMIGNFGQNISMGHDKSFDREASSDNPKPDIESPDGQADNGFDEDRSNDGMRPDSQQRGLKEGHGAKGSSILSAFNTLVTYLGIISLFSAITYYFEKLISRRRLKAS